MSASVLPVGWTEVAIGDLIDRLQYGLTAAADFKARGPRFLRITDLNSGRVDWSTVPSCVVSKSDVDKYRLQTDDFVFARTGSIEKAARVVDPPEAVFASYLIRGRPLLRDVAGWLDLFVGSYSYVNQAKALSAGIGRANLNAQNLSTIRLPLPPVDEQQRIGEVVDSYLTRLDDAVASLERAQAKLKAYRTSVLRAAVEGRLVPTEAALVRSARRNYEPADVLLARILKERRRRWEAAELARLKAAGKTPKDDRWKAKYEGPLGPDTTDLPLLPEGWCWAGVDQLGIVSGGLTQNAKREAYKTRLPFLRVANVYANTLVLDEVKTIGVEPSEIGRALVLADDLLVVEGNGSVDQIGRVAVWDGSIQPILHQNHLIKVRFEPRSLSKWVLAWLLSPAGRRLIEAVASSTSGLHTLSISKIGRLPVPLPPLAEQARAVENVDSSLSLADAVKQNAMDDARRCFRLRQAVLKWAFDGKLVAQDPNDEPAEKLLTRIRATRAAAVPQKEANGRRRKGTE